MLKLILRSLIKENLLLLALLAVAFAIDVTGALSGIYPSIVSGLPSLLLVLFFIGGGALVRVATRRPLSPLLAGSIAVAFYFAWFVVHAYITGGDQYTPTLLFLLSLIGSYRLLRFDANEGGESPSIVLDGAGGTAKKIYCYPENKIPLLQKRYISLMGISLVLGFGLTILSSVFLWLLVINTETQQLVIEDRIGYAQCMQSLEASQSDLSTGSISDSMRELRIRSSVCRIQFGVEQMVQNPYVTYLEFTIVDLPILVLWALVASTGLFLVMTSAKLYSEYDHLGWKRLSTVLASIPATTALIIVVSGLELTDSLLIVGGIATFIAAYLLSFIGMLWVRDVYKWVKSGF